MKKIIFIISLLIGCFLFILCGCIGKSEAPVGSSVSIDGVKYTKVENGYEATKIYDKELEEVILLEDIDGIPVTSIGVQLFKDSQVNDVLVPNNVETIKGNAFVNCKELKTITISNKVRLIEEDAFYGCTSLIGFYYNGDLSNYCNIKFSDDFSNPLFYAKKLFINNEEVTKLEFTEDIEIINDYAFAECYSITQISSNNKIKSIGYKSFKNCINLESDIILNDIQNIGDYAFNSCDKINNVEIGNNISKFGISIFTCDLQYTKIGNIYYMGNEANPCLIAIDSDFEWNTWTGTDKSCRVIAPFAFAHVGVMVSDHFVRRPGIHVIDSFILPDGLRYIGESAFLGWEIESIRIPSSIEGLGKNPFGIGGYKESLTSIVGSKNTLIYYRGGKESTIGLTPYNIGRNFSLNGANWDSYWANYGKNQAIINGLR